MKRFPSPKIMCVCGCRFFAPLQPHVCRVHSQNEKFHPEKFFTFNECLFSHLERTHSTRCSAARPINSNVYWKQPQRAKIFTSHSTIDHLTTSNIFESFAAFHIFQLAEKRIPFWVWKGILLNIFLFEGAWGKKRNAKRHFEKGWNARLKTIPLKSVDVDRGRSSSSGEYLAWNFYVWKRIRKYIPCCTEIKAIINKGKKGFSSKL